MDYRRCRTRSTRTRIVLIQAELTQKHRPHAHVVPLAIRGDVNHGRCLLGPADSEGVRRAGSELRFVSEPYSDPYHLGDYSNYTISPSLFPHL